MGSAKVTTCLATAFAVFALGVSTYEFRAATILEGKASQLTQERDRLQEELNRSEQRTAELAQQGAQTSERISSLQKKLASIVAAKPVEVIKALAAGSNPRDAERMAQMKPLLEKGMPIKGAVIVLVDGKPIQRPVQFVIGNETRIDASDDGIYVITPTLNEDGSIKYTMILHTKDPSGGPDRAETLPYVIQTPWEGFTVGTGKGRVIAFDPD